MARNSLSVLRKRRFLKSPKEPQRRLKRLLGHQTSLTKHFWWVKYKQIRFTEAKFFLTNMNLIMGLGLGVRKKRLGEWSWETCWVSLITNDCRKSSLSFFPFTKTCWYTNTTRAGFTQHCYCSITESGDDIWFSYYLVFIVFVQSDFNMCPPPSHSSA